MTLNPGTYPAWTPAPQPGIIPLHPLSFGQILGRVFSALRHNPKVLFGFAVCFQVAVTVLGTLAIAGIVLLTMPRLETASLLSDDYGTIAAGNALLIFLATLVIGLFMQCVTIVVQAVVAADVAGGIVAERQNLGQLWHRVTPVLGRLIGYTFLIGIAMAVVVALPVIVIMVVTVGLSVSLGRSGVAITVVLMLLLILGVFVLFMWLNTKLSLATSAIVLERATIGSAIRRSWTLTRGRFWVVFGVTFVIGLAFGMVAGLVGSIAQMIMGLGVTVFSPTGTPSDLDEALSTILTATLPSLVLQIIIQSVGLVVSATALTICYTDARMRREGLDADLLAYVEKRDLGEPTTDPFAYDPARVHTPSPAGGAPGYTSGVPYPMAPGYGPGAVYGQAPGYGQTPGYPQTSGYPQTPAYPQTSGYGQTSAYPQTSGYGQTPAYPQTSGYGQAPGHGSGPAAPPYGQASSQPQAPAHAPQPDAPPAAPGGGSAGPGEPYAPPSAPAQDSEPR